MRPESWMRNQLCIRYMDSGFGGSIGLLLVSLVRRGYRDRWSLIHLNGAETCSFDRERSGFEDRLDRSHGQAATDGIAQGDPRGHVRSDRGQRGSSRGRRRIARCIHHGIGTRTATATRRSRGNHGTLWWSGIPTWWRRHHLLWIGILVGTSHGQKTAEDEERGQA